MNREARADLPEDVITAFMFISDPLPFKKNTSKIN